MVALLYLKHAFDVSDEELVERWSENVRPTPGRIPASG
jgi:IS5 family transposase